MRQFMAAVACVALLAVGAWAAQPMPDLAEYGPATGAAMVPCPTFVIGLIFYTLPEYKDVSDVSDATAVVVSDNPERPLLVVIYEWGNDLEYRNNPDTPPLEATMYVDRNRDGVVDETVDFLAEVWNTGLGPCEVVEQYLP